MTILSLPRKRESIPDQVRNDGHCKAVAETLHLLRLASARSSKTTLAMIPVDAEVREAFPRWARRGRNGVMKKR
jgi:hypothetical protein